MKEIKASMTAAVNTPHQSTLVMTEWAGADFIEITLNHNPSDGTYYTYSTDKIGKGIFSGDEEKLDKAIDEVQLMNHKGDFEKLNEVVKVIRDILHK